jgi:hypothetical protein
MGNSSAKSTTNTYKVAKRNVLKTLFTVFGCFVLCSSCNEFFFLVYFFGVSVNFNSVFYNFTVFAMFSICCLNPFIYAIRYNEFKAGFKVLVNKSILRKNITVQPTAGTVTDTQL